MHSGQRRLVQTSSLAMLLGLALLLGCGGGSGSAESSSGGTTPADAASMKHYPLDRLPAVSDALPPLDGGRIEISPPIDWDSMSRDAKYVARFVKENKAPYIPRITIKVAESGPAGVTNISSKNATTVASKLELGNHKDVAEKNKPIILGENVWVRHVRRATNQGDMLVIQSLQTVRGSRLYNVELTVAIPSTGEYKAAMEKHRELAYAVAAHMKFLKEEAKISESESEGSAATPASPAPETPAAPAEKIPSAGDENPKSEENPAPPSN